MLWLYIPISLVNDGVCDAHCRVSQVDDLVEWTGQSETLLSVHIGTYCGQLLQVFTNATLSFSLFKDLVLLRSQCNLWREWSKSLQITPLCATHSLSFNHGALLLSPFPQLFTNLSAFCSDSSFDSQRCNANFYCIHPNVPCQLDPSIIILQTLHLKEQLAFLYMLQLMSCYSYQWVFLCVE